MPFHAPRFLRGRAAIGSRPHTNPRAVNDDQGLGQFVFCHLTYQAFESPFGLFHRRRPYPKAHKAMVALCRKGTAIDEVFIEGNDESGVLLRPDEDLFIGLPGQPDIAGVTYGPRGLQRHQPTSNRLGNILVEKNGQPVRHAK